MKASQVLKTFVDKTTDKKLIEAFDYNSDVDPEFFYIGKYGSDTSEDEDSFRIAQSIERVIRQENPCMSSTNLDNDEEASELEDLFEVSNRNRKKPLDETRDEINKSTLITHQKR